MPVSKKVKEITEKIEALKEILTTMPKNNEKNIAKYKAKIEELEEEYKKYEEEILKTLKNRYEKEISIEQNVEIDTLKSRLKTIENTLYLLNDSQTSYEKMELDKIIYKLGKYYKENFENINNQILLSVKKFSEVGIELDASDFDYSSYAKEYMETFFKEATNGNVNSDNMKSKFESIYWKCPDVIMHIELNLRNLYLKNQTIIDKYFLKEKTQLLKNWNKTQKEIMNSYLDLKKQKIEKEEIDKSILLKEFLSGSLQTKNYTPEKIKGNCEKLITVKSFKDEEVKINISKFLNSLYEFKNYINFKFILEDVKEHYKQKEQYKKIYAETKKKIDADESKLRKLNKKSQSKGLFGKKDPTKQTAEQNKKILEIKELYKKLELDKFYNKIYTELSDNSTIYDVLNLASCYYDYLVECIIKNNKTITQEEIDELIQKLNEFLKSPYNTIINNITILEEKDLGVIIKDRYKLLDFNLEKEDVSADNIDNMISLAKEIKIGFNIEKAGLDIKNIEELCELKKLLKC